MRPHIVTLGTDDLKRARRFYGHGLGFTVSPASQGDIVFFATGGAVLALYPRAALAREAGVHPKGKGFSGITLAFNTSSRKDVAKVLAKAAKAGGKILKPAQDVFWGGHSGTFSDPDGHVWEVAWNPHFPFDKQGNLELPKADPRSKPVRG
jgi:catechol 2,3-dioxygenase-like lactoylglutathione lyase family enzyme